MSLTPPRPAPPRLAVMAMLAGTLGWVCGAGGGSCEPPSATSDLPLLRLDVRGTVGIGAAVRSRRGGRHPVSETSGIAWLGDDRYAAVMDGSDRLLLLAVELVDDGTPLSATALDSVSLGADRDWEDVAVIGSVRARRLFAVAEDVPALCEFDVDVERGGCRPVGTWPLGSVFPGMRANRGPEALAAAPDGSALWTANEEALAADGGPAADDSEGIVRLVRLPLPPVEGAEGDPIAGRREWLYPVDPPHRRLGIPGDRPYSGVVAIAALAPRRLLVLERSAGVGVPPLENRIYVVDVTDLEGSPGGVAADSLPRVAKTMLWRGSLGVNLEGLCLGPMIHDGGRAVVAIADNGARARLEAETTTADNPLVVFSLSSVPEGGEPTTTP